MALSGFVDLIVCKMNFAAKQNVTKLWGLAILTLQDANPLTMSVGSRR